MNELEEESLIFIRCGLIRGGTARLWKNSIILIGPDYRLISGQNKRRKQAKKTSEENKRRRTEANYIAIRKYLKEQGLSKINDIAAAIELSPARTRVLLKEMSDVSLLRQATNRIKGLIWEGNRFLLLHKRPEDGAFS